MPYESKKTAAQYDAVAGEYAEAFSGEHAKKPLDGEMLRRFAKEVAGRGPVWDLGCGPGHTAKYLRDLGVEVSGLDLSEGMLGEARRRCPGIPFRRGDLLALDFPDESLAGALAFYSIVHFSEEQAEAACREVFRVLKPGGVFLLTFHIGQEMLHIEEFLGRKVDIDFMFFRPAFISACLKRRGFERIEIVERDPYPDVEYQSRRAYALARKPVR